MVLHLTPGFDSEILLALSKTPSIRGVVLQTYGTGNAPSSQTGFLPAYAAARSAFHSFCSWVVCVVVCLHVVSRGPRLTCSSIKLLTEKNIAVVIQTQCLRGFVQLSQYVSGKALVEFGVITSFDMTIEATVTKLAFLIGKGLSGSDLKTAMETDLRGELSKNKDQSLFKVSASGIPGL